MNDGSGTGARKPPRRRLARAGLQLMLGLAAGLAPPGGGARAQGIPVFDTTAVANQIQQLTQMANQLKTMQDQLAQSQQLYGSLAKLTNMADVASVLNDPAIRQALPPDFAGLEQLFSGSGTGPVSHSASRYLEENRTYSSPGNDFYASELTRQQQENAGAVGLAQQVYETSTRRMQGIDQLRQQIGKTTDPKDAMDLQARLSAEAAFLQTDILKMQALQMIQQAQLQVQEQRSRENWRQRLDAMGGTR